MPTLYEQKPYRRYRSAAFSRELFLTRDLEPLYCALYGIPLPRIEKCRYLVAYWCFDHEASAARAVEESRERGFWPTMRRADREGWPRSFVRRGFWHERSGNAIEFLSHRFADADSMIDDMAATRPLTCRAIQAKLATFPQFGPYATLKAVDMTERILSIPIDNDDVDWTFDPKPTYAAVKIAREEGLPRKLKPVIDWLRQELDGIPTPGGLPRRAASTDIETCLCKYATHRYGNYVMGADIRKTVMELAKGGSLGAEIIKYMPPQNQEFATWEQGLNMPGWLTPLKSWG